MESKGCQDILTRIKQFTAKPEFVKIAVIAGFAGIALILFSGMFSGKKTQNDTKALTEAGQTKYISLTEYENELEQSLAEIIASIDGAGSTKVMLTMENSVEYVYLKDSTTKTKEVQPVIRGVLVVCEGGDDPVVVERVTQAVTKALDISTAKVCISKLSS